MNPVKTITGKTSRSQPIGNFSDPFPTRGTPSDNSPPYTTSLHLARQVSTSHDESPPQMTSRSFAQAVSALD
jgi:hypothetical protein